MKRLIARIRENHAKYRQFVTLGDDLADIASAILITLGALALSVEVAVIFGGHHG